MASGGPLYSVGADNGGLDQAVGNQWAGAFSPTARCSLLYYYDGLAQVWNYRERALIYELVGHTSFVFDAAFSTDGALMATASGDGTAQVWQPALRDGPFIHCLGTTVGVRPWT